MNEPYEPAPAFADTDVDHDADTDTPADAGLPIVRLAERWADFTKAFAIYPETNQRVRESLDALFEALREAVAVSENGEEVEVYFHRNALLAGEVPTDLKEGTNLRWLHDRVHKAALAGVVFAREVPETSVTELTRRLLSHFARQTLDESFEELWPETYPGLELVERRFEGAFGDEGVTGGGRTRSWGDSGGADVDLGRESDLVGLLAGERSIQRRLVRLKELFSDDAGPEEEFERVDVLGRLVHLLPTDAIQEYDDFVEMTAAVLDHLDERVREGGQANLDGLNGMLFTASRGLLGRQTKPEESLSERFQKSEDAEDGKDEETAQPNRQRGHAGDEDIVDDVAGLLTDLEDLPTAAPETIVAEELESRQEHLDVLLHNLVQADAADVAAHINSLLARLLIEPGPAEVAVLRDYLTTYWRRSDDASKGPAFDRLVQFLLDMRQGGLLRQEGFLTAEITAKTFPRFFGLFLDSLDSENTDHMGELKWVLESVGRGALTAERERLLHEQRLLDGDRITRLFASQDPCLLPLVRMAIESGDAAQRAEAIQHLKGMDLTEREACLFRVVEDPMVLPSSYLLAMATPRPDGSYPPELGRAVASFLCEHIRGLAGHEEGVYVARRAYAIQQLGKFRTPEAKQLLLDIVNRKRLLFVAAEPPAIRQAAKEVLLAYGVL